MYQWEIHLYPPLNYLLEKRSFNFLWLLVAVAPCQICWLCRATKGANNDMDLCFTNASETAAFWGTYCDSMPWLEAPPYSELDGFEISQVVPDLLHVLNLGVGRDVCGSILKTLVKECHVFAGETIDARLHAATVSLHQFARAHALPLRMKKLSRKKLNWGSNRYAELSTGSGYDVSVVARWLEHILAPHTSIYPDFATLLWSLNKSMSILYDDGPWFLSDEDRQRVRTLGSIFMRVFLKLANAALTNNEFYWRCRPKLHMLHHIFRCHRSVNPAKFSTWMDEDWLKKISKPLRLVSAVNSQARILQRWLLALPLHLQKSMNIAVG